MSDKRKTIPPPTAPKKIPPNLSSQAIDALLKEIRNQKAAIEQFKGSDGHMPTTAFGALMKMNISLENASSELQEAKRMLSAIQWELHNASTE